MKEKVGLDFFAKIFYPSRLKVRGDAFYCIGKRVDMERNAYDSDLYRIEGGLAVCLTASHDIADYALLEDGVVFASARLQKDKDRIKQGEPLTVFQRLPYGGGEAQEHLRLPYSIAQAEWLPGGALLFRAAYDHILQSFLEEHGGDMEKALKHKKEQDEALAVVDELPFWFNGEGFVNKKRTALYLYRDGETRMLTDPFAETGALVLNEARTQALFTLKTYEHVAPLEDTLHLLDIASGRLEAVEGLPKGGVDDYAFGPEETALCLVSPEDAPHGMFCGNPVLYSVALAGGQSARVLEDSGLYNYHSCVGSDARLGSGYAGLTMAGGRCAFVCTLGGDSHLMTCDPATGAVDQLTQAAGLVQEFVPYQSGYAMLAMRGDGLCDLYAVDPKGRETRLTDLNGPLLAAHEIVTPIPMTAEACGDAPAIHGWVMPPVGYVPGKVYPAILNIHGGPKTVYGAVFFHEMQYWCAQGYAVLFCNPRGSDGRGEAFADIRGKYGTIDYEDILRFADEALKRFGFISALRMGVTGGSYGGFMTNWIIGHTDRFRAAASQRSISNWTGFATTSDIGHTFGSDQMQGTPWTKEKALWHTSPLRYADKVQTPTLFIHSEEDYRCNMFEGIQMFYALRTLGVETRLCLFKGENHELSRSGKPKNRIRRLQEITRWMDKYLKAP